MKAQLCLVTENKGLGKDVYLMTLDAPLIASLARPGQFIMIKVSPTLEPFLPRPFSIFFSNEGLVQILYKVVGRGTRIMREMRAGDKIYAFGPLGNGFRIPSDAKKHVLVGGGMGVAGLHYLARTIAQEHYTFLGGFKTKEEIPEVLLSNILIATEDGSLGYRGMITSLLEELLMEDQGLTNTKDINIFACGPMAMLREVVGMCSIRGLPSQVLVESPMACGVGACLGCVIKTREGYKRVCKDGPVFDGTELDWGTNGS